ncbi:MAG: hypothetical protein COW88_01380 [Candidatus Lloydbacteria bacterium CG22_combo_CG10-13_8_21_14_all_47_15]|uniref:Uncharacterized protein n=1 Tax=Candidatus Lloydbacteria bacterium CG22_combo_CG10-13_8_21_14_all_47_15 TaxID=1974635 RepID=A0A2H0CUK0_9BACT|nr:MAG: hypothetical protein COW88_01380 [Candidatus Lloydbacteria bacterium CG22_combo_CG10-13_8_21_14_all_47_15]
MSNGWSYSQLGAIDSEGVYLRDGAINVQILYNNIYVVKGGVRTSWQPVLVRGNTLTRFSGDGMNITGSNATVEYNTIQDILEVSGTHNDSIQIDANFAGMCDPNPNDDQNISHFTNMVFRGNQIYAQRDPTNPFPGIGHGITTFGGVSIHDSLFENNIIQVPHQWGITITGAKNVIVRNNTTYGCHPDAGTSPGVVIDYDPNVTCPQTGNEAYNNIAAITRAYGGTTGSNISINPCSDPLQRDYFIDAPNYNFHLNPTGNPPTRAIDGGNNSHASSIDYEKDARPYNGTVDIGADEYRP